MLLLYNFIFFPSLNKKIFMTLVCLSLIYLSCCLSVPAITIDTLKKNVCKVESRIDFQAPILLKELILVLFKTEYPFSEKKVSKLRELVSYFHIFKSKATAGFEKRNKKHFCY